ncbi:MAG TPA: CofH family radical SAM protein [Bacteroidales bacterium]|nr:CofH family radical SAM protein [Bacteroidales bacterium]HPS49771.1 CofH family radical SAM protein [Bacteroidales bacterium]
MAEKPAETMIRATTHNVELRNVARKIMDNQRISVEEGVSLFEQGNLGFLGILADHCRQVKNGDNAFYIRNFHIEPTNICVNKCRFCSYSHHFSPVSWELMVDEILEKVRAQDETVRELHITGAVHPARDIVYYGNLLKKIREMRPGLHIKAYSAVELDYMIRKSGMSIREGLQYLKACGLESIPGGGAEIFDETIRQQICSMKIPAHAWLEIHETAHLLGIPSNATILYGHIENYRQRIEHLAELRAVQDRTGGFNAFIPLKFRNGNNLMDAVQEVSVTEDMKMYAVSRIFLDNFRHLKAYWPAVGRQLARISLSFGVDDLDGTINDSTRIYSLAGAEDQNPVMTVSEMIELIREAGRLPVERDSFYNPVHPGE